MKHFGKILTLILVVPFLTELLTGNLPAKTFFSPAIFLFLIIFYGFAILIIREISVRWKLDILGIFCIGLGYGILNEGVLAETVFMTNDVPMAEMFGHYPLIFGINLPFTFFIIVWHALHSVLFPILIIDFLFPNDQKTPWINKYVLWILSLIVFSGGILVFFNNQKFNPPYYLFIFYVIIFLTIGLSNLFKSEKNLQPNENKLKPVFLGVLFSICFFIGKAFIATTETPFYVSLLYLWGLLFGFYKILKKWNYFAPKPLLLFGLGSYLLHTVLGAFSGIKNNAIDTFITGLFLTIALSVLVYFVGKKRDF